MLSETGERKKIRRSLAGKPISAAGLAGETGAGYEKLASLEWEVESMPPLCGNPPPKRARFWQYPEKIFAALIIYTSAQALVIIALVIMLSRPL